MLTKLRGKRAPEGTECSRTGVPVAMTAGWPFPKAPNKNTWGGGTAHLSFLASWGFFFSPDNKSRWEVYRFRGSFLNLLCACLLTKAKLLAKLLSPCHCPSLAEVTDLRLSIAMGLVGCRYQTTKDFLKRGLPQFLRCAFKLLKTCMGIKIVQKLMSSTSMETAQQQMDLLRNVTGGKC